jgi:leader peptidase (prepilin peptidase)/N-methyltransferase
VSLFDAGASPVAVVLWAAVGFVAGVAIQTAYPWLRRIEDVDDEPRARWLNAALPLAGAALFALLRVKDDSLLPLVTQSLVVAALLQVFAFDLQHRLILDRVILPATAIVIVLAVPAPQQSCALGHCWTDSVVAAAVGGLFYFLLLVLGRAIFRRDALGWGDVKLAVFIGAGLGFGPGLAVIWALIMGMMLGGVIGVLLVATRLRAMGDYIPYAPFMVAGAVLAIFLYVPPHQLLGPRP